MSEEEEVPVTNDGPVAAWLKWTYLILPIWGVLFFYFYWNGSSGWFDRGHWQQLQQAANTTFEGPLK